MIIQIKNKKICNNLRKKAIIFLICLIITASTFSLLMYFGIVWPNSIFANAYIVYGIDVSNHQGYINWKQIAQNKNTKFVFIKATEGENFQDKKFTTNWIGASQAGLYKGAYHYFTVSSSGIKQANNFIRVVPNDKGCLPPVVDIEENGLGKDAFKKELKEYFALLEKTYRQKPIIYVVYSLYNEYIKGDFENYPIWIRDIIKPPNIGNDRDWLFWQYCDRGRLEGIQTYVDLNVFREDIGKLTALLSK